MGFTKLFSSIITSSIWSEDDKVRIMWITMLASADASGKVDGAIPGMARIANMSLDDAERSIQKLCSPDPYSRTPDHEGRRLVPVDGGWQIVNYLKYREQTQNQDGSRASYYREYRAGKKGDVARNSAQQSDVARCTEAEAEAEADTDIEKPSVSSSRPSRKGAGPSPEAVRLSDLLLELIQARKPDFIRKGNWARDIDLMIRIDRRPPPDIEAVIRWCQADCVPRNGFCWANNVLSGATLRRQYDRLDLQRRQQEARNDSSRNGYGSAHRPQQRNRDYDAQRSNFGCTIEAGGH